MASQTQINEIARQGGVAIIKAGTGMLKSAFDIDPLEVPKEDLFPLWVKYKISPIVFDNFIYVLNWDTWKQIIKHDWLKEKKYIKERYDCDNFAFSFASRMSELFDINSVLVAIGQMNKEQHAWNIIITGDDKLMAYEPQTGAYREYASIMTIGQKTYSNMSHLFLF